MWTFLGKLALSLAPSVLGYFLGKQKEPATISQPMGGFQPQFEQYLNTLMGITQGNMPEAVSRMEDRIKSQIQAEAGSLLNRTVSALASRGVMRSGLPAIAGRDISSMAASELANRLAQLEFGVYQQAMSGIPAILNLGRQGEMQAYQQRVANQQALWNSLGNLGLVGSQIFDYFFGNKGGSKNG